MSNHTNAMSNHKLASAKDNLFDNSSMTFREHLDELRKCLVKAIIALSLGLLVGLYFANDVVKYVADPLRAAILEFNAQKDLALMGFEKGEDEAKNARLMQMVTAMRENSAADEGDGDESCACGVGMAGGGEGGGVGMAAGAAMGGGGGR